VAHIQVSGLNLLNVKGWFSKSNPLLRLSRAAGDSGFVNVYESERIKKNLNPHWAGFTMKIQKLCNGDYDRPIRAEVWSRSKMKEKLIGECNFTVN